MPQGFTEAPLYFSHVLHQDPSILQLPRNSILIQHVNDLLLCSSSRKNSETDSKYLLQQLVYKGHKASQDKFQLSQEKVHYLGHDYSKRNLSLSKKNKYDPKLAQTFD